MPTAYSQRFAEEDRRKREETEARNQLDQLVYTVEKSLDDLKDKISDEDKGRVEHALSAARQALSGDNLEDIKRASEDLQDAAAKLAEEVYRHASAQEQAANSDGNETTGDTDTQQGEVFDAEFREKNEKDKKGEF